MVVNRAFAHRRTLPAVLNYAETHAFATGALGGVVEFQFAGNGFHDPTLALGGHQPRGFDTYVQMYKKYYVKKVTANVTFEVLDGTLGIADRFAAYFNTSADTHDPISQAGELVETARMNGGVCEEVRTLPGRDIVRMTLSCIPAMLTKKGFADPGMSGTDSANPSNLVYLHLVNFVEAYGNHNVKYTVELLYDAVFYDPIDPVYSA